MANSQSVTQPGAKQTSTLVSHSVNPPVLDGTRLWTKPVTPAMTVA
jgi:hypothetical protein